MDKPQINKSKPFTKTLEINNLMDIQKIKPQNDTLFDEEVEEPPQAHNLNPPCMVRQEAVNENLAIEINQDNHIELDTDSDIDVQSVNFENESMEADSEAENDSVFEEEIEEIEPVIGELIQLENKEYRYLIKVNGKNIFFGDRTLPDVDHLKKQFSNRKFNVMMSKIKSNYRIKKSNDVESPEFWNFRVYLTSNPRAEYEKLRAIYNISRL